MPGQSSNKTVPDDVKQFLRSILMAKSGVKQSRIEHDYSQLVGEILPWRKLGFESLFEFLMSIPDVVKLEWREKDEDNRVFAVLDKTCFNSVHAKRMADGGFGQGTKPLSPSEIAEWRARKRGTTKGKNIHHSSSAPANLGAAEKSNMQANSRSSWKGSSNHKKNAAANNSFARSNDKVTSVVDQTKLPELLQNARGLFSVYVKVSLIDEKQKFPPINLLKDLIEWHFEAAGFKPFEVSSGRENVVFCRFKSRDVAANAIEKMQDSEYMGLKLTVNPASEKILKKGEGILPTPPMSLLVNEVQPTAPSVFPGQQNVPVLEQGLLPLPLFSMPWHAALPVQHLAERNRGVQVPNIQPLPTQNTNIHSKGQQGNDEPDPNVTLQNSSSKTTMEATTMETTTMKEAIMETTTMKQATGKNPNQDEANKENTLEDDCWHNFLTMSRLFQMSCRKRPPCASDFPDKIQLIITFALDACRFWMQRSEFEEACRELDKKLGKELENVAPRSNVLPGINHFGAAKFYEDGVWYRCWVLGNDKSRNELKVYFCDYGNTEVISADNFMCISKSYWTLPPQAIPVKLHGFKQKTDHKLLAEKGVALLNDICTGKVIEAEVVKDASNSESHVIMLKSIKVPGLENACLEDELLKHGIVSRWPSNERQLPIQNGMKSEPNTSHRMTDKPSMNYSSPTEPKMKHSVKDGLELPNLETPVSTSKLQPSIFEYQPNMLLQVKVSAVDSPSLFYMRTCHSEQHLAKLKKLLESFIPEKKGDIIVGSMLCLKQESGNLRVVVIELACNFLYSKMVHLHDPDSGRKIRATVDDLYDLSQEIKDIPTLAERAALAGIRTENSVTHITSLLRERIDKESFMNIISAGESENESGKLFVELFDDKASPSFNWDIVRRGLAKRGPLGGLSYVSNSQVLKNSTKQAGQNRTMQTQQNGAMPAQQNKTMPAQQSKAMSAQQNKTMPAQQNRTMQTQQNGTMQTQQNGAMPAQQNGTMPAQQNQTMFAQRNKTMPAQENKTIPAQQNKTMPAQQNKTMPAQENKTIPAQQNKTIPAQQNKTMFAQQNKTMPAQQNKTMPAQENKTIPAQQNKTMFAQQNKTMPAQQNKTMFAQQNKTMQTQQNGTTQTQQNGTMPAQENKTMPAQQNKTMFAQQNKTIPAQENKTMFAQQNKTMPAQQNKTMFAQQNKTIPAQENKTMPAQQNKTMFAQQNKTMFAQQNKTMPAQQNKTMFAQQNKTIPAQENKTMPAQQNKTMFAQQNKTMPAQQNKTMFAQQNKTMPAQQNKTMSAQQNKTMFAQQNKTIPAQENKIIPAQQNKTMPAQQNKTMFAQQNKTIPAQQNKTMPAQQNKTMPAQQNKTMFAQQNKTIPAQQNKTMPAQQNGTTQTQQNGTMPAQQNKTMFAQQNKTMPARQNKTMFAQKTMPGQQNGTMSAQQIKAMPAQQNKTREMQQNKTMFAQQTMQAQNNKAMQAHQNKAMQDRQNKAMQAHQNKAMQAQPSKHLNSMNSPTSSTSSARTWPSKSRPLSAGQTSPHHSDASACLSTNDNTSHRPASSRSEQAFGMRCAGSSDAYQGKDSYYARQQNGLNLSASSDGYASECSSSDGFFNISLRSTGSRNEAEVEDDRIEIIKIESDDDDDWSSSDGQINRTSYEVIGYTTRSTNPRSNQRNGGYEAVDSRPRYRPYTPPPLPDLIEIESPVKESDTLKSSLPGDVNETARCAGLEEFLEFDVDGRLDRERIKREVMRWTREKERLERYQKDLMHILSLPDEKIKSQNMKHRRRRLELHVKTNDANKRLAELKKELSQLESELRLTLQ
eukprot:gene9430-10417_t